ncbi:SCO family protein [Fibrella sp. HMF5335]|uniref:SCO family protein n=1 Tax=Fibrella rubiginis TaxID=2817060 RepID=A0A939GG56_9BACT|nr:SCO family protein [Fibrella rubiginis]MBO0938389.1 SCO family protein [Fibrella rubiginis]
MMLNRRLIKVFSRPTRTLGSRVWLVAIALLALAGCAGGDGDKLPILGQREAVTKQVDGKTVVDSVYHTIPDFAFVSQYGDTVTAKTLAGKVYVADFFFTSCPTICPKMKTQLKRVYEQFGKDNRVVLLSHTIDPSHDTVPVLKAFADQLGVTGRNWLFVTGDRDKIYDIGQNSYMVTAAEDASAPGGVVHSGAFILVDPDRHIRGIYDGTKPDAVDKLIADMTKLLAEK